MRETQRIRYGMVSVVYGEAFTRLMADTTLPTHLSPGNIPALAEQAEVTFHLYATHASQAMLRAAPAFSALERVASVVFHDIRSERVARANTPYEVLQHCHARAVAVARERDESLVVLSPDAIWSDGSFARMHELAEGGARAVMMTAPRTNKASFLADLPRHARRGDDGILCISHRGLMRCMLENLHEYSENLLWREDRLSNWPSQLYWRAGESGLLVRALHLHPLLVRPLDWAAEMPETIDGRFVAAAVPDTTKIHVVRDSDEIAACEMTDRLASSAHLTSPNRESGTKRVAAFMQRETDALHRSYFEQPILLHGGPLDAEQARAFDRAELESMRVFERIQRDYEARIAGARAQRTPLQTGDRPHVASHS